METIKINGKNYKVSFIDTEDTIKNMIALHEKVFTNYIKFTVYNLKAKDIQIQLLPDELDGVKEKDLAQTIDHLHQTWGIPKTDLALEWLHINRQGKISEDDPQDAALADIFSEINFTDFYSVDAINTAYKTYQKKKTDTLKKLTELVKKEDEFRQEYAKYEPLPTSKFLQDSVIIEYQITINLDPLEAFDGISVNSAIPFVRLKTRDQVYYKVLEKSKPQKEWLQGESTLEFKLARPDGWGTATINYTSQVDQQYTAVMTIESSVKGEKKTTEKEIQNSILALFTGAEIQITSRQEKGVKGVFAVPEISIARDVFLDLITNEPMVSHYLYVDETRELSSQKGVLYLYYSPGDTEEQILTVFLSERSATRNDIFFTSKELLLFTPYLNVRVSRALNLDQIDNFKQAFAVILAVYKKKFKSIVKAYDAVIPGFKAVNELMIKKTVKADKRLKALQTQDPELFIHGYPTSCERKRQPIAIPAEERGKQEKRGRQVMEYPKKSKHFYICGDENEFQYPGLMKNKLNNRDMYQFLPCCYPKNQKTGKKTWNLYLKGEEKKTQPKTANIVTKKAVDRGKYGQLPRNIHYILQKSAKKGEDFLRQGVAIGNNSFIEAVFLALDKKYEHMYEDPSIPNTEIAGYIRDFRNNLAAKPLAAIVQELYDLDSEKIIKDILDPDVIFDSKVYTGLLEAHFNCQIIVFTRTDTQPNGEYEIPRYTQGYLYSKFDPNKRTVLIYKHLGSRADNLENPHYELIIRTYKKIPTWYFKGESETNLLRDVYAYFRQSYKLYSIGIGRYEAITIPPQALADATGQVIDRYGKTRGYTFEGNVFMATSPLTPADEIPMVPIPDRRASWERVQKFINKRKLTINEQDISEGSAVGVTISFPRIPYAYIPFRPTAKLVGVPAAKHLGFSVPTKEDILQQTVNNKKIADFLMQLMLYSFSLWYADKIKEPAIENELQEIKQLRLANQQVREKSLILNLVEEYLGSKVVIESDHIYNVRNLPRRLSINNSFFQDGQLVVDSQKTFDKLSYYLRFMITKNQTLVLMYSGRTFLDNYYTFAVDFQERKGQLIFIGGLGINNWIEIQEHGVSNQIHTVPHWELVEPYFFAHWAINGGRPVIFQNVQGGKLSRALAVAAGYIKNKINLGFDATGIQEIEHTTYFLEEGVLKKEGVSPVNVWRFAENFYAALIVP